MMQRWFRSYPDLQVAFEQQAWGAGFGSSRSSFTARKLRKFQKVFRKQVLKHPGSGRFYAISIKSLKAVFGGNGSATKTVMKQRALSFEPKLHEVLRGVRVDHPGSDIIDAFALVKVFLLLKSRGAEHMFRDKGGRELRGILQVRVKKPNIRLLLKKQGLVIVVPWENPFCG